MKTSDAARSLPSTICDGAVTHGEIVVGAVRSRRPSNHKKCSFFFGFPVAVFLIGWWCVTLGISVVLDSQVVPDLLLAKLTRRIRPKQNGGSLRLPLAGLSCEAYGGPLSAKSIDEVVYWKDIPEDSRFLSPLGAASKNEPPKYLTFEVDEGRFNNIRMSLETVLTMAHAMGRILVLPPKQDMYLENDGKTHRILGFQDFFPIDRITIEQKGLEIISTDDFLLREGITGHLRDRHGSVSFPPHNRTNWNGMTNEIFQELQPWLRGVSFMPKWNPEECLAAFPASKDPSDAESLQSLWDSVQSNGGFPPAESYFDLPTAFNASVADRLGENIAGRSSLCIYNTTLQQEPLLHFHGRRRLGARLLTHFYAFLFFENWRQGLWTSRFVRDHLRYNDDLQCAAARIIEAVRERARKGDPVNNAGGLYSAFHIRRGEFQYKRTRVSAEEMYNASQKEIPDGATVYIATDEHNKTFFKDLATHYDLVYLDDFLHLVPGMDQDFYGMLDQLVASRAYVFFGCYFSTFSGYINRIRGYHADRRKEPGYELGKIASFYYAPLSNKYRMTEYWPLFGVTYAREFPVSWRMIDEGTVGR